MSARGIKKWLYDYLTSDGDVSSVLGARVYPSANLDVSPQSPYATFQRISHSHTHDLSGASGLASARFQIDVWSSTPETGDDAAEAIRDALDGLQNHQSSGEDIRSVFLNDEDDSFVFLDDGSNSGMYRARMDFTIWHTEAIPSL